MGRFDGVFSGLMRVGDAIVDSKYLKIGFKDAWIEVPFIDTAGRAQPLPSTARYSPPPPPTAPTAHSRRFRVPLRCQSRRGR